MASRFLDDVDPYRFGYLRDALADEEGSLFICTPQILADNALVQMIVDENGIVDNYTEVKTAYREKLQRWQEEMRQAPLQKKAADSIDIIAFKSRSVLFPNCFK